MDLVFSGNRYNQHPFMGQKDLQGPQCTAPHCTNKPSCWWVVLGFGSESVLTVWRPSCNKKDDNILIIIQQTGLWFIFVQHPTTHFVSVDACMQNMDQQSLDDTTGRTSSR